MVTATRKSAGGQGWRKRADARPTFAKNKGAKDGASRGVGFTARTVRGKREPLVPTEEVRSHSCRIKRERMRHPGIGLQDSRLESGIPSKPPSTNTTILRRN